MEMNRTATLECQRGGGVSRTASEAMPRAGSAAERTEGNSGHGRGSWPSSPSPSQPRGEGSLQAPGLGEGQESSSASKLHAFRGTVRTSAGCSALKCAKKNQTKKPTTQKTNKTKNNPHQTKIKKTHPNCFNHADGKGAEAEHFVAVISSI